MRFGKSSKEAAAEPGRGGSGDFIRNLKDGDNTFRILQDEEPEDGSPGWAFYWEHYSPGGFSFPCPRKPEDPVEDCPGCSSDNERMKKVSRKVAFNVLHSFNGQEYVDVYKVPNAVADKLKNRIKRFGTVTDRDYTITRYKTAGDRYDFDVEGAMPAPVDFSAHELKDIEEMLQKQWNDAWGDPNQAAANLQATAAATATPAVAPSPKRTTIAPQTAVQVQPEEPPFEPDKAYKEGDLRAMDHAELVVLVQSEMKLDVPTTLKTSDAVVDWLMELQS